MQAYSSVYSVEQELKQELKNQEQAKQEKEALESSIHETELRIAKLVEKSQDSNKVSRPDSCTPLCTLPCLILLLHHHLV